MTERPILFSAPMVRALLDGRKTQTRRILKLRGAEVVDDRGWQTVHEKSPWPWSPEADAWVPCPFGAPGDRLWVRETWAPCEAKVRKGHFQYAADGAVGREVTTNGGERWWERSGHTMGVSDARLSGVWVSKPSRWRPSIHMPRKVSRLTLEVTGVRVERLQDISEADARAEGAQVVPFYPDDGFLLSDGWTHVGDDGKCVLYTSARDSFRSLWESINGAESWASNPWVWVVSFKRVTP